MPNNWKTYKLGDVVSYVNGGAWAASCYNDSGIPVVRVSDVNNGAVDLSVCKYLDIEYAEKYKKHTLIKDDVIVCTVGSHPDQQSSVVGGIGIVSDEIQGAYLNQNAVLIRSNNSEIIDQRWLGYLAKSPIFKQHIEGEARGSANQVRIAIGNLLLLEFELPPLPEQRTIATILSSLDDKIELNLQTNKTLEEMAMTLYKHWFVDFGPFKDGKFIDSELGQIPEGWEVKRLEEIIEFKNQGVNTTTEKVNYSEEGIPVIRANNIGVNQIDTKNLVYVDEKTFDRVRVQCKPVHNDILFTNIGSQLGSACLSYLNFEYIIAWNVLRIKVDLNFFTPELLVTFFNNPKKRDELRNLNSSSTMPFVSGKVLGQILLIIPEKNILDKISSQMISFYSKISMNHHENQTLTALRDTLLPKLISGEVRVKDAEQTLKEVL